MHLPRLGMGTDILLKKTLFTGLWNVLPRWEQEEGLSSSTVRGVS